MKELDNCLNRIAEPGTISVLIAYRVPSFFIASNAGGHFSTIQVDGALSIQ